MIKLPPYVTTRKKKDGVRYYFQVPTHARPASWSKKPVRLSDIQKLYGSERDDEAQDVRWTVYDLKNLSNIYPHGLIIKPTEGG